MASRYLKSLATGVVLPYNEAALKSAGIRLMEPAECAEYEASIGLNPAEAAPEPVFEEVVITTADTPQPEPEVVESDDDDASQVLAALEVD